MDLEKTIEQIKTGEDELLEFKDAFPFLKVKKSYLYQLTFQRKIPYYKKSRKIYFLKSELLRWILDCRQAPISELEREAERRLAK